MATKSPQNCYTKAMNLEKSYLRPCLVGALGLLVFMAFSSCAMFSNIIADSLTGEGSNLVFTGDNDPQLVGDALPFGIKMYESLLAANPKHLGLIKTTGSLYVMYANAFVAGPADYLGIDKADEKIAAGHRALNLYLRGRGMLINGLENDHPGFRDALLEGNPAPFLAKMQKKDVPFLYWIAAAWFGALSQDNVNVGLSMRMPNAKLCLDRAYALDPDWGNGSLDELYIQVLASIPAELGGSLEQAETHFKRALELAKGNSASPYIGWATTVLVNKQEKAEFIKMMEKALAVDPEKDPERRLVNTLAHERAAWYLKHLDDFFID